MRTNYVLMFFVLLFVAGNIIQRVQTRRLLKESEQDKRSIRSLQHKTQLRIDSMRILQKEFERVVLKMNGVVAEYRDSLVDQRTVSNKWRKEYARVKITRLPADIRDDQLDSVITTIVGHR